MKKLVALLALALAAAGTAFAQTDAQKAAAEAALALSAADKVEAPVEKPQYWTKSFLGQLEFNQTSFTNWVAGGYNNVSLGAYVDANANYAKDKATWTNRLQLNYGFLYSKDKPILQKNNDRILMESKYGYKAAEKLKYTASFRFLTQFDNNYNYKTPSNPSGDEPTKQEWKDARVLKSGFLSPGDLKFSLGIDWLPTPWLTVNLSPLTSGFYVVLDKELRRTYGMPLRKEYEDLPAAEILPEYYMPYRFELGAQLTTDIKFNINERFTFASQLVLFSDFLDHPQYPRINWDTKIGWQITRFFRISLDTWMIYDHKVLIADDQGVEKPRVQLKEAAGLRFTYLISNKKK